MKSPARYPRLVWSLDRVRANARAVVRLCAGRGVEVCAVTKGVLADARIVNALLEGGCTSFADSRVENLAALKKNFPGVPRTLLRIPMESELDAVLRCADCSCVSMPESVLALEERCRAVGLGHQALLMFDLGDRREGILEEELEAFAHVFRDAPRVRLRGVGVNFACFAGVLPGNAALVRLEEARKRLEALLGYPVPICSGGSTSSLKLIEDGALPEGVNQLRVAEAMLLGQDVAWQRTIPWLSQDTVRLEAQVIEVRKKPSLPHGPVGADAFGAHPVFADRGERVRAIVALGRQDVPPGTLRPLLPGVEILGGSSDHTLLDVQDGASPPRWGDVLSFALDYGAMLGLMTSPYVGRIYR